MAMNLHNCRCRQFDRTGKNPSGFRDLGSAKSGPSAAWFDKCLAHGQAHMGQMGKQLWHCTATGLDKSMKLQVGLIHPTVSVNCVTQILDPICGKFDKFLARWQAHMGQMGKRPWQCTTTGLDNSTELGTEKIRQAVKRDMGSASLAVTHPATWPPGPWRQYPTRLRGRKWI